MAQRSAPEALIIGAGHNGLVCACYLAAAGVRVTLLERRHVVGGAAVTEEFHPGFRNSVASYTVSLLNPRVIADLRLAEHGLRILERPMNNLLPLADGDAFSARVDSGGLREEVARFSRRDAERLDEFQQMLETVADQLRATLLETPPGPGGGIQAVLTALRLGQRTRALSASSQRDLHEIFTRSAGEILDDWFESEPIKALYGFDAVVGNYAGPYAPGSAYVLLHHAFGEVNGRRGVWGHAVGGMGAITQAMAAEARRRGVTIVTDTEVSQVQVRAGRACGVVLADGRELTTDMVIANVNPRLLYLQMIDAGDLDQDFLGRIRRYRCGSGTLRMNVALAELPRFHCLPGEGIQPGHQSGIVIAPSLDYMERAWLDARQHGWSRQPVVEMMIPSTMDDSLAPARTTRGQPVLPAFRARACGWPYLGDLRRRGGRTGDRYRDRLCAEFPRKHPRPHGTDAGRSGTGVRSGRRRYFPRRAGAGSVVQRATGARLRRLSWPAEERCTCVVRAPIQAAALPARRDTMRPGRYCAI